MVKLMVGIRGSMTDVADVEIVVRVEECVRAGFKLAEGPRYTAGKVKVTVRYGRAQLCPLLFSAFTPIGYLPRVRRSKGT